MTEKTLRRDEPQARSEKRYPPEQIAYMESLKRRINGEIQRRHLSINQLRQILTETYALNLNLGTLSNTINPVYAPDSEEEKPNYTMNFFCMVALCDYFGIDFNELRPPRAAVEQPDGLEKPYLSPRPPVPVLPADSVLVPFTDEKYMNEYRLFAFIPTHSGEDKLYQVGQLSLSLEQNEPKAVLVLTNDAVQPPSAHKGAYSGVPLLNPQDQTVFLPLADRFGFSIFLYFRHTLFKSMKMVFRCALLFRSHPETHVPMVQKLLIANSKGAAQPGAENWPLLKGALRMNEDKIFISRQALASFLEDYSGERWMPAFQRFVRQKISDDLSQVREDDIKVCYTFSQNELMTLGSGASNTDLDVLDRLKMVYTLLSRSEMPEQIPAYRSDKFHRLFM